MIKRGAKRILNQEHSEAALKLINDNALTKTKDIQKIIGLMKLREQRPDEMGFTDVEIKHASPSKSTICRALKTQIIDYGLSLFSFKRLYKRGPDANSDPNKTRRIKVMEMVRLVQTKVYIDESHRQIGVLRTNGWSAVGKKGFVETGGGSGLNITAICSISDKFGVGNTQLLQGNVDGNTFIAYMKYTIQYHRDKKIEYGCPMSQIVYFMDNSPLHKTAEVKALMKKSGEEYIFNASYSSPMNPVENVFGFWKMRCEKDLLVYHGFEDFIKKIRDSFFTITQS